MLMTQQLYVNNLSGYVLLSYLIGLPFNLSYPVLWYLFLYHIVLSHGEVAANMILQKAFAANE